MDLRQLKYFLAVAEHRHFTRGAEASFVSQPALSQQIRALERELGVPLFDRLPSGVELTAAGRVLKTYAERVIREVENAKVAVEEVAGRVRGELSISTVHTANVAAVLDGLARFRAAHPDVLVRVHEERAADVAGSVLSGRVNLGITYLPCGVRGLEEMALYEEELVLVLPADHPLAGGFVDVAELGDLPLIVPPGGFCLRDGIDRVLDSATRPARVVAEMSAMDGICDAVRTGLGVTLLPIAYASRQLANSDLALARISPAPRRTVGAVRHADRHLCLASRAFLLTLGEVARAYADPDRPVPRPARATAVGGRME